MTATSTLTRSTDRTAACPRPAQRHAGRGAPRSTGCRTARSTALRVPDRPDWPGYVDQAPVGRGTHLTGRGRLVVLVGLVLLLLAAFSLGRTGAQGSTEVQPRAQVEQATVLPGETLWAVAQRLAPGQDPRPVVDEIRRLNGLASAELRAGQQLLLPVAP